MDIIVLAIVKGHLRAIDIVHHVGLMLYKYIGRGRSPGFI